MAVNGDQIANGIAIAGILLLLVHRLVTGHIPAGKLTRMALLWVIIVVAVTAMFWIGARYTR